MKQAGMRPECRRCKHFYTTWEPRHPRGCKAYGFKTAGIPSEIIKKETGQECLGYEEREHLKQAREKNLDLNRDDLW